MVVTASGGLDWRGLPLELDATPMAMAVNCQVGQFHSFGSATVMLRPKVFRMMRAPPVRWFLPSLVVSPVQLPNLFLFSKSLSGTIRYARIGLAVFI